MEIEKVIELGKVSEETKGGADNMETGLVRGPSA
jgi:hypothetical protein